eukprot:Tamp_15234.p2 GENE.Tamp_15234~~Tamp_15234.p2  ORF type:complete len:208 (+),score=33.31 Tamp_15234:418-1041(+)
MSVWETIFGRAPDPTRRTSQYAHDGVRRAELASIRRVVEVIGCDEHEARARLQNFGWSVHETIAAFLREPPPGAAEGAPQWARARPATAPPLRSSEAGWKPPRGEQDEPNEEEKAIACGLFMSLVPNSTRDEARRCLQDKRYNVQDAIKSVLHANPELRLFDGEPCDVPIGIPISDASPIPTGGDVWESDSVAASMDRVPVGIAIEP